MENLNPLETRSLPGALWEKVPTAVRQIDIDLSLKIENSFDKNSYFWDRIHFLTEEPSAIAVQAVLFLLIACLLRGFYRRSQPGSFLRKVFTVEFVFFIIFLLAVLAVSDLLASFLKGQIGRLKPHVDFYNPAARPALSLPSNHALNCASLVGVFLFTFKNLKILEYRRLSLFLGFCFLFLVGLSRIVLGEHHILDVLTGWFLGFLWAYLATSLFFYFRGPEATKN